VPAQPDCRWENIVGEVTPSGLVVMMTFEHLDGLAAEWGELVVDVDHKSGPGALLRMSRSLFAHAWFDYEFMVVACLLAFQAMEAAFRALYPGQLHRPFLKLVRQARQEGVLPPTIADLAETGVELRNRFSHPETQAAYTVGMAAGMLENTHRLVALVMAAASEGPESHPV
jgi:hypothetical protein